jgi:Flp pilus assembly protein TadB
VTHEVAAVVLSALLAAAAAALLVAPTPAGLPRVSTGPVRRHGEGDGAGRHHVVVAGLAGLAPVLLVGGWIGLAGGLVAAVVVRRVLARREAPAQRRRREAVARSLPQVVDLLGVALSAGAAPPTALASVARAVDGPVAEELAAIRHGLTLGRDPVQVWQDAARRPGLAALGRAMSRAVESGASVSDALHRLAEDLRSSAQAEAEARARTVGVRAAVPLGLCLLPAFVLLGIVPLVAATVGSLLAR